MNNYTETSAADLIRLYVYGNDIAAGAELARRGKRAADELQRAADERATG